MRLRNNNRQHRLPVTLLNPEGASIIRLETDPTVASRHQRTVDLRMM